MAPTTCPSATMSGNKRTPMTPVAPAKKILISVPRIASLVYIASACTIAETVALSKTRVFEKCATLRPLDEASVALRQRTGLPHGMLGRAGTGCLSAGIVFTRTARILHVTWCRFVEQLGDDWSGCQAGATHEKLWVDHPVSSCS